MIYMYIVFDSKYAYLKILIFFRLWELSELKMELYLSTSQLCFNIFSNWKSFLYSGNLITHFEMHL